MPSFFDRFFQKSSASQPSPETNDWRAGFFSFALPLKYALKHHSTSQEPDLQPQIPWYAPPQPNEAKEAPMPWPKEPGWVAVYPLQRMITTESWTWEAQPGDTLQLIVWSPNPPHHGGPMRAADTWMAQVAGGEVSVTATEMFFGKEERVLVSHIHLESPQAACLLIASVVDRDCFMGILASIELHGNSIKPRIAPKAPGAG